MSARSMLRRLAHLEREKGLCGCPVCGRPADGARLEHPRLIVDMPPADGPEPPPGDPDPCPACGRPRVVILQVKAERELHPLDPCE